MLQVLDNPWRWVMVMEEKKEKKQEIQVLHSLESFMRREAAKQLQKDREFFKVMNRMVMTTIFK